MNHKKDISKHRHKWALPATPPKYWSIGFPTTQEVEDINNHAREMSNDKRKAAEMEARLAISLVIFYFSDFDLAMAEDTKRGEKISGALGSKGKVAVNCKNNSYLL